MNPMPGFYKHSAPLEPGTGWGESRGSTNIRLRWSREPVGGNLAVLQTFGSAGAANRLGVISRFYKHSAPLEPGTGWGNLAVLQTFGSAGAGNRLAVISRFYKHWAPLEPGEEESQRPGTGMPQAGQAPARTAFLLTL